MELLNISLQPDEFNRIIHNPDTVPEMGDMKIACKKDETHGTPIVAIGFTVRIDGKNVPVQAVTTLKLLETAVGTYRHLYPRTR